MARIIGLSGRARSGKTSLAKYLCEYHGAKIVTIANSLKKLCCDLLNVDMETLNSMKDDNVPIKIDNKEKFSTILSISTNINQNVILSELNNYEITNVRELLQIVGTNIIRKYNENWHADKMIDSINEIIKSNDKTTIVIDDVRFKNERNAIENIGGNVFFILRTYINKVMNHTSEISLKWFEYNYDKIILNNSTKSEFLKKSENILYGKKLISFPDSFGDAYVNLYGIRYGSIYNIKEIAKHCIGIKYDRSVNMYYMEINGLTKACENELIEEARVDEINGAYRIYNPFIIENLKLYL